MIQKWDIAGMFLTTHLPGFFSQIYPIFSKGTLKERPRLPTYLGFFIFQKWDIAGTFLPTYLPTLVFTQIPPIFFEGYIDGTFPPTYLPGFFYVPKMRHCWNVHASIFTRSKELVQLHTVCYLPT